MLAWNKIGEYYADRQKWSKVRKATKRVCGLGSRYDRSLVEGDPPASVPFGIGNADGAVSLVPSWSASARARARSRLETTRARGWWGCISLHQSMFTSSVDASSTEAGPPHSGLESPHGDQAVCNESSHSATGHSFERAWLGQDILTRRRIITCLLVLAAFLALGSASRLAKRPRQLLLISHSHVDCAAAVAARRWRTLRRPRTRSSWWSASTFWRTTWASRSSSTPSLTDTPCSATSGRSFSPWGCASRR